MFILSEWISNSNRARRELQHALLSFNLQLKQHTFSEGQIWSFQFRAGQLLRKQSNKIRVCQGTQRVLQPHTPDHPPPGWTGTRRNRKDRRIPITPPRRPPALPTVGIVDVKAATQTDDSFNVPGPPGPKDSYLINHLNVYFRYLLKFSSFTYSFLCLRWPIVFALAPEFTIADAITAAVGLVLVHV